MTAEWLMLSVHHLGAMVYGGSVIAFAVLLSVARRLESFDEVSVLDVYRAWGSGLGLAMGALIFGGLGAWYLQHGGFVWPLASEADQLSAVKLALFLVLWVSSFHLEIWTLEGIRKLQSQGSVSDPEAWGKAFDRVVSQLSVNAVLVVLIGAIGVAAGLSG